MEGVERAKKTSDMCYKKWKNEKQPSTVIVISIIFMDTEDVINLVLKS
jgi:hypothetical protein